MFSNDIFFEKNPDPMWIYDRDTLAFLAVNDAAVSNYEYSRAEFLDLTIADIRPMADRPALRDTLQQLETGYSDVGTWRHLTKSGRILIAEIRSHQFTYADRRVSMVSARDITALIESQAEQTTLLARERTLEQRLANTLEELTDGFATFDKALVFTFINRAGELILKKDRADVLGKSQADLFPEAVGHASNGKYLQAMETGQVVRFTAHFPPLDSWFEVHAHPSPEGLAVYFRDVTQQRAKDDQLRLLEKAVSHLNDIVIITAGDAVDEPDGPKVVYVNAAFTRHTGYEREELLGRTPRMLQGPNTQRSRLDAMRQSIETWQPHRTELINYTKYGAEIWLDIEIVPVADKSGFFTHWVSVQRDITERKRAEEAQRLTDARFQTIARAVNDAVWEWDLKTDLLWWSEALKSTFGHEPAHLAKDLDEWKKLIHPDDRERVVTKLDSAISASLDAWQDEYRFARADGSYATVSDHGRVVRNAEGAIIRMVGTLTDITERRELDMRLAHAQKLEALGKLSGGIAHDFNNLLTVIIGNTDILAQRLEPHTALQSLASLSFAAAQRGAELTSRLLAFGRRQSLSPKPLDVGLLTKSLSPLLLRTLPESVAFNIIASSSPCTAQLDAGQLETALLNLVINARDSMPTGGLLTILTEQVWLEADPEDFEDSPAGQYVAVSVIDTGSGMDDETALRAFEPFFTTKEAASGSGFGLSMVYGFVKQSSGRVKISTSRGTGSTVAMFFPVTADTAQIGNAAIDIGKGPARPKGGQEKILVVEDDQLVQLHVTTHLADLGYQVIAASDGDDALEILHRDSDIALLFTDIVMPGTMTGGQLANKALQLRPKMRILFTSGHFDHRELVKAVPTRGMSILNKPYRLEELAQAVRSVLDTKTGGGKLRR